ncbi:MAG: tol-pal system protein YbgF [Thermodesulfobacteriota bacterium]|nr:tol-pal system protein YbgF [Thermodesulfobacteriota bacterium]
MQSVKNLKGLVFSEKSKSVFLKAMRPVVVALLPMLLVHCAPQDQVNMLERRVSGLSAENRAYGNQINSLKQKVAELKKITQKVGKQDIASVRSRQAELANRMDELQVELLRMNGFIDQIGHQNEQKEKETVRFREDLKEQVENLREEVKLLQASTKVTKEVEQARKKAALGAVDLYQQALDLIKQKNYKDAKNTLRTYIEKHPHGKRVANAYFWMGECEYNIQRFEEAILEYQKVISRYPKSNKVPDSLLKQGMAFAKLGDNESAKIVLNKLIKKYPKSPQASVAKKKLARIK